MKLRGALVATVTALVLLGTGATPQTSRAQPPETVSGINWQDCGGGLQCGHVEVPLDYARPAAGTIRIGLVRLPATSGASQGSVVMNPGTLAGGGVAVARRFGAAFAAVNRDFDLIGLDTRGTGTGDPLVRCTTYEENRVLEAPMSADLTIADRDERLAEAGRITAKCQERSGDLLPYFSSTTSARDLDRVRIALGEDRLRFIGISTGSILGQNYLKMFPRRVKAMILDSPFDAEQFVNEPLEFDIDQMVATERTLGTFFSWCAATPSMCAFGNGNPRAAFEQLLAKTRQNRIENPGRHDIVTDGSLVDFVSGFMLFPQQWPVLGQRLAAMAAEPVPLAPLPTGEDRVFAEYYSQTCLDRDFPDSLRAYDRHLLRAREAAPYLGGRYGYAEFKCVQWPAEAAERTDGPWLNPFYRPVLVLSATDDPLAPYAGTQSTARRLLADRVVLRSSGHFQLGRTPCADAVASQFLLTGRAPWFTVCTAALPGHQQSGVRK
jgi:pimeloyl-ACP methyl ester carboxylesterase